MPTTEAITTRRLTLEPLRVEHAEKMVPVLADPDLYVHMGGRPPDADRLRERYARMLHGSDEPGVSWHHWIIRTAEGTATGMVQATVGPAPGRPRAVLAWMVGIPWQRRGIATEAAQALTAWLHEQGISPVTAHIHPDNTASAAVARACGLHRTDRVVDGEFVWTEAPGR